MNKTLPKITVVTVCLNAESNIEKTILSVINQTYPNLEYIVIDGGSSDGTTKIIERYSQHITIWKSEHDRGIYDAMNKGAQLATGRWINFCNAGDFFVTRDSVSTMFAHPIPDDVDVIHGDCYFYSPQGYYLQKPWILTRSYKSKMPVLHPATFVRTDLQKSQPFSLDYRSSSDYKFFYDLCEEGHRFLYIPQVVTAFDICGISSNWRLVFFEKCKIQHLSRTPFGILRIIANYLKISYYVNTAPIKRYLLKIHFPLVHPSIKHLETLPVPSDF